VVGVPRPGPNSRGYRDHHASGALLLGQDVKEWTKRRQASRPCPDRDLSSALDPVVGEFMLLRGWFASPGDYLCQLSSYAFADVKARRSK